MDRNNDECVFSFDYSGIHSQEDFNHEADLLAKHIRKLNLPIEDLSRLAAVGLLALPKLTVAQQVIAELAGGDTRVSIKTDLASDLNDAQTAVMQLTAKARLAKMAGIRAGKRSAPRLGGQATNMRHRKDREIVYRWLDQNIHLYAGKLDDATDEIERSGIVKGKEWRTIRGYITDYRNKLRSASAQE